MTVAAVSVLAVPGTAHAHTGVSQAPAPPSAGPSTPAVLTATPAPAPAGLPAPVVAADLPASAVAAGLPVAPAATATPAPPYPVVQTTVTLTDASRSTPARGAVAGAPTRVLRTLVLTPATAPRALPVIVFAPGYNSQPESYLPLLDAWAARGYLVVAPDSPGSAGDLPGSPVRSDIAGQAQDLSFTISAVLGGMAGPVDATRITVAGHSDGGSAVAVLALDPAFRDVRIASYVVLSGAIPDAVAGPWGTERTAGRLLVVVGDADEYGNLPASTDVFDTANMTKTLVVARGGDHLGTYLSDSALAFAVRSETLSFLDGPGLDGHLAAGPDTSSLTITESG